MTPEKNSSMEHVTTEELAASAFSSTRLKRHRPTQALAVFVVNAVTSSYDEDEVEAFYMGLEEFYKEGHAFFKEDDFIDNIDEKYDWLIRIVHVRAVKAESAIVFRRRLSLGAFELNRQHVIARGTVNR
uniref:Protein FAR1-RELATED SEQUENCE n=1 Tax=Angiostrongylus cantonensis TaxID=6313 RepID=A0A0K0DN90_ANGCA